MHTKGWTQRRRRWLVAILLVALLLSVARLATRADPETWSDTGGLNTSARNTRRHCCPTAPCW